MAAPPQGPSSEQPPTEQPPTENPPEEERAFEGPLGVALLGLGSYASEQLAPALQLTQQCRLVGLVTGTPSKAPQWQAKYGIPVENSYSYETLAQIRDNPDIHVVYVVTPPSLHKKYAIAAAEAGKHVWCEKPMALSEQECRDMIAACQQNGVKLCIGYRMQHEPNTRTVIEYATSRPYGKIVRVDALAGYSGYHGGDTNVWRLDGSMGGGALYDMGVYTINAARYATGEEPIQVRSASQWTERPDLFMGIDEWTEFELVFPSGAIAYGRTSFGENINSLDVECATGSYRLAPMQQYTGVKGSTSDGVALDRPIDNQQARQMDDDALAIIEGRDVIAPGEEGLRDIILITAIRQAALTGMPVDLV
jgi:glucose-fructose oxidoreductase